MPSARLKWLRLIAEIETGLSDGPVTPSGRRTDCCSLSTEWFSRSARLPGYDLLIRAGLRNLAVERHIDNYGALSLEWLLLAQPELLIVNAAEDRGPAIAYEVLRHPALMQRYRGDRVVGLPSAWWSCPGPRLVDAVQRLRHAAQRLAPSANIAR